MNKEKKYLTTMEIAKELDVSDRSVRRWIQQEKLKGNQLTSTSPYRVLIKDFEDFKAKAK